MRQRGQASAALLSVLIECRMPGMQMGLKNLLQHSRILLNYLARLSLVGDFQNTQAALIVQKKPSHKEPLVIKELSHIASMFLEKGLLNDRFPLYPGRTRSIDDGKDHNVLPFRVSLYLACLSP